MFHTVGSRALVGGAAIPYNKVRTGNATLVTRTTIQVVTSGSTFTPQWNTINYDDVGAFSSANNTIMTVPFGYKRARHTVGSVQFTANQSSTGGGWMWLVYNGATVEGRIEDTTDHKALCLISRWYDVNPGDVFTLSVIAQFVGGNLNWGGAADGQFPFWGVEWETG